MEVLNLYDDNCRKLNETIVRGNAIPKGKNVMLSIVFIKNKDNNYLIQKTSLEKGNKYASTGGHVKSGEDGINTIIRELKEELGIAVNSNDLKHIITFKYPSKSCIFNVYLLEVDDINLASVKLQKEEVESVEWMDVNDIDKKIQNGIFLESHAYIFNHYIREK